MQQTQKRVLAEIWERRNPDVLVKSPEQLDHAGLDHREGNRPGRRAQPRGRRIHQSPAAEDQAAVRSDHHLWPGRRQGNAGPADQALRDHAAFALQHLCDRGPAAGTDRQSGPRFARSRRQPGAHARPVLRGRRHRRAHLYRDLRPAPEERRQAAGARKTDSERYRRTVRGCAAAARRPERRPIPIRPRPRRGRRRRRKSRPPVLRRLRPRRPPARAPRSRPRRRRWFSADVRPVKSVRSGYSRNAIPLWRKSA